MKLSVITLILSNFFLSCSLKEKTNEGDKYSNDIKTIRIELNPAFNNTSLITIDKENHIVQFDIDSSKENIRVIPGKYRFDLAIFEKHTLIDSFYSSSFLDSIKLKPENVGWTDGLSILTIVQRNNSFDTIESGNHYPYILSQNIISQLKYMQDNTKSSLLHAYIENLETYFP